MRTFPLTLIASLALLGAGAAPAAAAVETAKDVQDCVAKNAPSSSSYQSVTLKAVDRMGSANVSQAEVFWKKFDDGSRALLRFSAPPDLRGSAVLMIEKGDRSDMFMYLPELRKVRRVSKRSVSGSMFGTDFTYEDWERLQGLSEDLGVERLADAQLEGRSVYVLESRPARGEESDYARIVSYIDTERCLPLKAELYETGDRLRKVMTMPLDKQSQQGKSWIPRSIVVKDLLDETHTELTIEEIELEKDLPRKLFSQTALESGN